MKKFVCRVLVTFAAVVLFATILDIFITYRLHHSNAHLFQSWNDLFFANMQCDAVVMGSSRSFVQYDPTIFDSVLGTNCYNLGIDGRCIDAEVIKFNVYCQHNPKPKLIIQNVDFCTLSTSNGYEREQFLPYLRDRHLYNLTKNGEDFSWTDRIFPLIRYAGYFQVIKEGLGLPNKLNKFPLKKGYYGREEHWDGCLFETIDSVSFSRSSEAVAIFENYLAQCKADGIQVILVFAPIYIGVTEKMDRPQQMFDFYDSIAMVYNCPVLNYTYNYLSYDTAYFYNATHLNKIGSELFTRKLAHDIDSLQLLIR